MSLKTSYPTEADAAADLVAHGFTKGEHFYKKPSADGFGFPMTALATVERNAVDPQWGKPDYFTVEFHNH